ncbi:TadE family protein [Streptomyces sp. NBC_01304]|uniref:TadE family protein n=1 Tax=Streptomyces sp. NBC_01304 TaxID=2903818 RepID=UPI002E139459|nr:pilus assembly protein [Streptomyces sp. NBC_01304]
MNVRSDRGAAILEFTGFLPLLLFIALAVIQLGLVGYTYEQAGSAARAAARSASQGHSGDASGKAAISSWLASDALITGDLCFGDMDTVTQKATLQIPTLVPFVDMRWEADRTVTMPCD